MLKLIFPTENIGRIEIKRSTKSRVINRKKKYSFDDVVLYYFSPTKFENPTWVFFLYLHDFVCVCIVLISLCHVYIYKFTIN